MIEQIAGGSTVEKTQEELKQEVVAPATEETVTLTRAQADEMAKALEESQALATKKSEEAENYKKGMLKAKGKLLEEGFEDEEEEKPALNEERIGQIFKEQLEKILPVIQKQTPAEEDELAKANRKMNEMRLVLQNKATTPTSSGTNLDKVEVKTTSSSGYWSAEQVAELKSKGLDPDEVFKNLPKAGQTGAPMGS